MFCNNTHKNQPSITIHIEQVIMPSSQCTLTGVVHSALPPMMVLCPYCGFRRSPPSQSVKSEPKPTATSTASSSSFPPTSFNTTVKNRGKAPVFVIDSDAETILDDTKPTNSQIIKPFSNKAFLRNKKIVEDSRREGFVRREEKKKLKGRYEVGGRKIATVSDNRAVDIHIGPVKGRASEFEFLGKTPNSFIQFTLLTQRFLHLGSISVHFRDITVLLGNMDHFIRNQILTESVD